MASIQPNKQAKVIQAKKRLKVYLNQLLTQWDGATTVQRFLLIKVILVAVLRIELARLDRLEDIE